MSYKIYINNILLETNTLSFALSKQNNDIADISNRNADLSQNIKIPRTLNNIKAFERTGMVGVNSEFPYKKNIARIIDTDTGIDLISDGMAILLNTDVDNFNISIYSGNINFFKAIENLTLTDCDLTTLNHVKNLTNIKETWTDITKPYRYIIADYNGKMYHSNKLNIDYQIPSASVKYLWNRVFNFIGYEFEGAIFNNEEFADLWMSYPKPIPTNTTPNLVLINSQFSSDVFYNYIFYRENLRIDAVANRLDLHRVNFTHARARLTNANSWTNATSPQLARIEILEAGNYLIRVTTLSFSVFVYDNLGTYVGFFNSINNEVTISVFQNYKIQITHNATGGTDIIGTPLPFVGLANVKVELFYIDGYTLGFDKAFIDFKVSDFIKEIMMRFALTPFAIPNTNKVKFLTLDEIFQDTNIQDWTDKFHGVTNESYILSNYAKRNDFKFKYNDTNDYHSNGYIPVVNENLKESKTLYSSSIFSKEAKLSTDLVGSSVYPIWSKNIKDNGDVEYKGLENRFYFLRSQKIVSELNMTSEILSTNLSSPFYYKESYYRCKWQELINVWYKNINKLLDFTKVITANIYLSKFEFSKVQMERMVFINQLGSYFLINKISNYVPQKVTKVELIKVEYYSEPIEITSVDPYLNITSYTINNCNINFSLNTNLPNNQSLMLELYSLNVISGYTQFLSYSPVYGILNNNSVTFSLTPFNVTNLLLGVYALLKYFNAYTLYETSYINITQNYPLTCYVPPVEPTTLTLTSAVYQGLNYNNNKKYLLSYSHSTITPNTYTLVVEVFASVPFTLYAGTSAEKTYNGWTKHYEYQRNQIYYFTPEIKEVIDTLEYIYLNLPNITKYRIKINSTISNEINI